MKKLIVATMFLGLVAPQVNARVKPRVAAAPKVKLSPRVHKRAIQITEKLQSATRGLQGHKAFPFTNTGNFAVDLAESLEKHPILLRVVERLMHRFTHLGTVNRTRAAHLMVAIANFDDASEHRLYEDGLRPAGEKAGNKPRASTHLMNLISSKPIFNTLVGEPEKALSEPAMENAMRVITKFNQIIVANKGMAPSEAAARAFTAARLKGADVARSCRPSAGSNL